MDFPGKFGDHIMPDELHKINLSFIVNKFERRRGGTAGNTSYNLGLLNTKHILFSYAGKDFEPYKNEFKKFNISTKYVKIDLKVHTATGFAMTDKTDNQIWGYFYGAAKNSAKLKIKEVAYKNDLVHVGPAGAKGTMSIVKQCIRHKIPYVFDPGFILTEVSDEDLEKGVANCSYLIGNDYEITLIKNRLKHWETLFKNKTIITTLGASGAKIEESGKTIKIKVAKARKVVDPSGAGDAWRGGFLAGLQKGLDLKTCGQMGAVASSFAVEKYGTQGYIFTFQQFKNRYRQNYNKMLNL